MCVCVPVCVCVSWTKLFVLRTVYWMQYSFVILVSRPQFKFIWFLMCSVNMIYLCMQYISSAIRLHAVNTTLVSMLRSGFAYNLQRVPMLCRNASSLPRIISVAFMIIKMMTVYNIKAIYVFDIYVSRIFHYFFK